MYYAYDESTGTLILEHVEGFKNENNFKLTYQGLENL